MNIRTAIAGEGIQTQRSAWTFERGVAQHFVEHISRSVPFYKEGHDLVCEVSDFFCHENSVCYELGVSTGELIRKLAERHSHKPSIRWVGLDPAQEMIEKARDHCAGVSNIELLCEDAIKFDFQEADLIVSYYVAQFVKPRVRQQLFDRIYRSLSWGGALVLFEKVRGPDARFQDIATQLYTSYKRNRGYSSDEILNKTESLKSVLEPFSTQGNVDLMRRAGFSDITTIFKYVCFEGFLAIK